jgi:hypothetical protein
MTVFAVCLGWWLPKFRYENRDPAAKRREGGPPCFCLSPEPAVASTTDHSKYVYLSDGGHFDNLAIDELVRRWCKYITACDADADSGMTFGDLGNAIPKCRSDFGVEIKPTITEKTPRDVLAYRASNPVFPDQSTAHQWLMSRSSKATASCDNTPSGVWAESLRTATSRST